MNLRLTSGIIYILIDNQGGNCTVLGPAAQLLINAQRNKKAICSGLLLDLKKKPGVKILPRFYFHP